MSKRDETAEYREQAGMIGRYLSDYLAMSEHTLSEAACLVGATDATWQAWVHGKRKPAPKYARRISKLFPGMSEVFAFYGVGETRISKRRHRDVAIPLGSGAKTVDETNKGKAMRLSASRRRARLYLIEERHRVMQARRKREERTKEYEA